MLAFPTTDYGRKIRLAQSVEILSAYYEGVLYTDDCRTEHGFILRSVQNYKNKKQFLIQDSLVRWNNKIAQLHLVMEMESVQEMKQVIEKLTKSANLLQEWLRVLSLDSYDNPNKILQTVLSATGIYYGAERGYIFLMDHDAGMIKQESAWCDREEKKRTKWSKKEEKQLYESSRNFFQEQKIHTCSELKSSRAVPQTLYRWITQVEAKNVLIVPYLHNQVVIGCIWLENAKIDLQKFPLLRLAALFACNQILYTGLCTKEAKIKYYDTMTGVENGNGFIHWCKTQEQCSAGTVGMVVANINYLRKLNAEYGFEYGDSIIKTFGGILRELFAEEHIYRLAGDEFTVICENKQYECFTLQVEKLRKKIKAYIPQGVAIGMVWSEDKDQNIQQLWDEANKLMIMEKQRVHENDVEDTRFGNPRLLQKIQSEIKNHHVCIYLQAKINPRNHSLAGMEALCRYIPSEGVVVSPSHYIPMIERAGYIRHVDFYVLEQTCTVLQDWQKRGRPLYPVSVNFSRKTICEPDIADKIVAVVDSYHISHNLIIIEITESAGNMERRVIVSIGQEIISRGFGISLDDFCSEYSCASLLTALPFVEVKIDKSIVSTIATDLKMQILCEGVISICHQLGLCVTAEGVETKDQRNLLQNMECDRIQGYFYSKALPVEAFEEKYLID